MGVPYISQKLTLDHPTFVARNPHDGAYTTPSDGTDRLMHGTICGGQLALKPEHSRQKLTIDIAVLCIHAHPVKAASCNSPRYVRSWVHLPCSERNARACTKGSLKSISGLHASKIGRWSPRWAEGKQSYILSSWKLAYNSNQAHIMVDSLNGPVPHDVAGFCPTQNN